MVTTTLPLDGVWRFRPDPRRIGERYPEELHYTHAAEARWCAPDADLAAWREIRVPGLWTRQGHPDLDCGWYRLDFAATPRDGFAALTFEGVDYVADVWLNGHYLGSHEGCYGRFRFDVADLIAAQNVLVVRVDSPCDVPGHGHEVGQMKRLFRGALERWDMNDPDSKPAGIWGGVALEQTGPARIAAVRISAEPQRFPPPGRPDDGVPLRGAIAVGLDLALGATATLRYAVRPLGFAAAAAEGEIAVAALAGTRDVTVDFDLPDARLWWTWDLGPPHRYEVTLEVATEAGASDRRTIVTGFRHLGLGDGWDLRLNGVPLYQRGANYLSDLDLSTMTPARYAADVALMRAGNLNTAHPFAVVERDAFYDACDAAGLIVYQDFPIWMMSDPASDVVRAAVRQFDEMLERLDRHPSVAIWNFGSQPSVANFEKLCVALVRHARRRDPTRIAHHGNSAIAHAETDDVHPVRSFFWTEERAAGFERRYGWRRDCHMYPGWYVGDAAAIATYPPHHFGLVTEFGAQALPDLATLAAFADIGADTGAETGTGAIPWRAIAARGGQVGLLRKHNPAARTLPELIEASQRHQAAVIRSDIEFIRRRKLAGGHGLHVFAFNDCWPSVSWSVVDHDRRPKRAYEAMRRAMAPVQVFLDPADGDGASATVTVVNDTPHALRDARLEIVVAPSEPIAAIDIGTVPPCGALRLPHGLDVAGRDLCLTLVWTGGSVSNSYAGDSDGRLPDRPAPPA